MPQRERFRLMKFAIATLGCKVNQYQSQLVREALVQGGAVEQDFSLPGADLYLVNTCTVTHRSDAEARKLIRRGAAFGSRLVVTGCMAGAYPREVRALPGSLEVVPFGNLPDALGVPLPGHITRFRGHSRAFVNVQQGCSNRCTFCIVPEARGGPRSRAMGEILREIECLHETGFREIILTGINIGLYEGGAASLLQQIIEGSAMPRIRISSIEPWTVTPELVDLIAREGRICRHLHLPLQSGSDAVLSRMNRPYRAGYFRDLVLRLREEAPDMAIGSDVMVGFPGEEEGDFSETESLVEGLDLAYLHVFPYSKRPGTPAAGFDGAVGAGVARERARRMRELSKAKRSAFISSRIGCEEEAVVTNARGGFFTGVTSNYIKVEVAGEAPVHALVRIVLTEACEGHAKGRALE